MLFLTILSAITTIMSVLELFTSFLAPNTKDIVLGAGGGRRPAVKDQKKLSGHPWGGEIKKIKIMAIKILSLFMSIVDVPALSSPLIMHHQVDVDP